MRSDARKAMQEKRLAEQQVAASGGVDELPGLTDLLVKHGIRDNYDDGEFVGFVCACRRPRTGPMDIDHAAHVAEVIAREWLPERERAASEKAWDEGYDEGLARIELGILRMATGSPHGIAGRLVNPYRERADA